MSIYEYNEEYARKAFYEDGWEDGFKRGVEQGIQQVIEQGIELGQHQGKLMLVISLIRDGILTKTEAAERMGISLEQLEAEIEL